MKKMKKNRKNMSYSNKIKPRTAFVILFVNKKLINLPSNKVARLNGGSFSNYNKRTDEKKKDYKEISRNFKEKKDFYHKNKKNSLYQ